MHRNVIKISSGGVHNICIVEPVPCSLLSDVYQQYMNTKYTDVVFKGFYQMYDQPSENSQHGNLDSLSLNQQESQCSNSDEEMKDNNSSMI